MKNIWIAGALAALAGCAADIRNADEGSQQLPDSETAILFTPRTGVYDAKARRARFSAADGNAVGTFMKGYPDATRIAPGTYMLKVLCFDPTLGPKWGESFLLFQAKLEAGHFYELSCSSNVTGPVAIDRGTQFEGVKHLLHPDAAEKLRR
jgi:hypothetical protein